MPSIDDLQNEIAALRAERNGTSEAPAEQPPAPNGQAVQSGPVKPEIDAIFLKQGGVLTTTVGAIQLEPSEIKKITKIAARAFKRAMATVVAAISEPADKPRKGPKPAKKARKQRKAKKSNGPKLSKSGKPLGRPKKASTMTYEPPTPEPPSV